MDDDFLLGGVGMCYCKTQSLAYHVVQSIKGMGAGEEEYQQYDKTAHVVEPPGNGKGRLIVRTVAGLLQE